MAYKLQIEFLLSTFMTFGGQMMKIYKIFIDKQTYNCHILVINLCLSILVKYVFDIFQTILFKIFHYFSVIQSPNKNVR